MNQIPFTIVIPTRERADTLLYCLKTCTMQDYERLTILVSDNASQDDTYDIVQSFHDPRIKYINTGQRLSMSHNWEFALSHVAEGYVSILGDDDGFLPNAIEEAASIIDQTGLQAIRSNYGLYLWPTVFDQKNANTIHVSFRSGFSVVNGENELKKVLEGRKDYLALPTLYNSFVDIEVIKAIQRITGTFFKSRIPDVYSGVALAGMLKEYVNSYKSLKIFGTSRKSNGASLLGNPANAEIANQFIQEENLPIHPLASNTLGRSVGLLIGESFLQSFDAGLNSKFKDMFDWEVFIKMALLEADTASKGHSVEIQNNIKEIILKNNLNNASIDSILNQKPSWQSTLQVVARLKDLVAIIDASKYNVTNIHEACILYDKIYKNPLHYPAIISDTISKLTDTVAFASIKRFFNFAR